MTVFLSCLIETEQKAKGLDWKRGVPLKHYRGNVNQTSFTPVKSMAPTTHYPAKPHFLHPAAPCSDSRLYLREI